MMVHTKLCVFRCCCIVAVISVHLVESVVQKKLTNSVQCPNLVLSTKYRSQTFKTRSLLECLTFCSPKEDCRSIVFDADSSLCHLGDIGSGQNCSNMEETVGNLRFYEMVPSDSGLGETSTDISTQAGEVSSTPSTDTGVSTATTVITTSPCQNGGRLDENGTCVCVNSTVGTYCERYMEDCEDVWRSGFYTTNGQYFIQPSLSNTSFPVYCQTVGNSQPTSRNYIFIRNDASFTFNRTMEEFRQGFGDFNGDHWLGLDKMHLLTNSKVYELRIRIIRDEQNISNSHFKTFVVSDESSGYKFTVGSNYKADVQDCMSDLQGAKFSTYDDDNDDNADLNCAAVFGGGWWYKGVNCSTCNPLGPVLRDDGSRVNVLGESFWAGVEKCPFPVRAYLVVQG